MNESSAGGFWVPGRRILDDYILEKVLGEGGMGIVYLARRETDGTCFAVKTLLVDRLKNRAAEQNFFRELRTWIDLPEHPNLTACRFFRTVEDRLAIFADYVDGGSLDEWIYGRRLLTLKKILTVAIESAWGLHAAHEQGVIHQDVKPANILLTKAGTARITDFGLARARHIARIETPLSGNPQKSILLSSSGMTVAYCSPEQAARRKVSRRTDIWSWGLTVLEMFTGKSTWQVGAVANLVLEKVLAGGVVDPYPAIPSDIAALLRRCFRDNPDDRWPNLLAAADRLTEIYGEITGTAFPLSVPDIPESRDASPDQRWRYTAGGQQWDNPLIWLKKGYEITGEDLSETDFLTGLWKGSRKAQVLMDLEIYEHVREIFHDRILDGHTELLPDFARLTMSKILVHNAADDLPGAVRQSEESGEIYEKLLTEFPLHREYCMDLAQVRKFAGDVLEKQGKFAEAVDFYDSAMTPLQSCDPECSDPEVNYSRAGILSDKSTTLRFQGKLEPANQIIDQAISILTHLELTENRDDLYYNLAVAFISKATILRLLNEPAACIEYQEKAGVIYRRLLAEDKNDRLRVEFAKLLATQAVGYFSVGRLEKSIELMGQAEKIMETLVHETGLSELSIFLTQIYINHSKIQDRAGQLSEALKNLEKAESIYRQLIYREDRRELLPFLSAVYTNRGVVLLSLGEYQEAAESTGRSLEILEKLGEDRYTLENAFQYGQNTINLGTILIKMNKLDDALESFEKSLHTIEALINEHGRSDLKNMRADILANLGETYRLKGDFANAHARFDHSIEIRETLVFQDGKTVHLAHLANVYLQKAMAFQDEGRSEARDFNLKAIELIEKHDPAGQHPANVNMLEKARNQLEGSV